MRLNLSFKLIFWFCLGNIFAGQTYAIEVSEVPEEVRETFLNFISPQFDETKALREWSHVKNGKRIYHFKFPDDMDSPPLIGYSHKKNIKVFHAARTKEQVLFLSQYEFDKNSRRKVGVEKRESQSKHLVLAGCSFAMGTSLSDRDTIAFHIARLAKEHYPVNLGVAGSGTNTMLAMTRNNLKKDTISSQLGTFIYIYLDFHIMRANAFAMEREWLWDTPNYKRTQNNELQNIGNFKESEPKWTSFYRLSQALLRKVGYQFNFPKLSSKHIEYTCDLIREARRDYLSKFPGSEFLVYAHPYSKANDELVSCLKTHEIKFLESELNWTKKDVIAYDDHPNGEANKRISRELVNKLGL